jgi:ribosomal protein S24E
VDVTKVYFAIVYGSDEIRRLIIKMEKMDRDLIRVKCEKITFNEECAGVKEKVKRMRKRMNEDERNYKANRECMRKRINDLLNERERNRMNVLGMNVPFPVRTTPYFVLVQQYRNIINKRQKNISTIDTATPTKKQAA